MNSIKNYLKRPNLEPEADVPRGSPRPDVALVQLRVAPGVAAEERDEDEVQSDVPLGARKATGSACFSQNGV